MSPSSMKTWVSQPNAFLHSAPRIQSLPRVPPAVRPGALHDEAVRLSRGLQWMTVLVPQVACIHDPDRHHGLQRVGQLVVRETVRIDGPADAQAEEVGFVLGL